MEIERPLCWGDRTEEAVSPQSPTRSSPLHEMMKERVEREEREEKRDGSEDEGGRSWVGNEGMRSEKASLGRNGGGGGRAERRRKTSEGSVTRR